MSHHWDPDRYLVYADERGRPFVDLLARVGAAAPARVVDLGCGPGQPDRPARAALAGRRRGRASTPRPEMVARAVDVPGVRFEQGDVRTWRPGASRSTCCSPTRRYQWVPGHLDLLPALVGHVAPGGWFAFQVPGNHDEPSHVLLRRAAARTRASPAHRGRRPAALPRPGRVRRPAARPRLRGGRLGDDLPAPAARRGPGVHLGRGTGARPTLQALPADLRAVFVEEYKALLREAYPAGRTAPRSRSAASSSSPTHQCSGQRRGGRSEGER